MTEEVGAVPRPERAGQLWQSAAPADYIRGVLLDCLPQTLRGPRQVGCEDEFVVTDSKGDAVDCRQALFDFLEIQGWTKLQGPVQPKIVLGMREPASGTVVKTDAGWGILEIAYPPVGSLHDAASLAGRILSLLIPFLEERGWHILGMGTQPKLQPEPANWVRCGVLDAIRQVLPSAVDHVTLSASAQASVDVTQGEVVSALNVGRALSGPMISLCANSPLLGGQVSNQLAVRELFWDWFARPGSDRHGVGYQLHDLNHLVVWLLQRKLLVAPRDQFHGGVHYSFDRPLGQFLEREKDPQQRMEAFSLHLRKLWTTARLNLGSMNQAGLTQGVVEIRPACQQQMGTGPVVAALSLGIMENLPAAVQLVGSHPWKLWEALRLCAIQDGLQGQVGEVRAKKLAEQMLAIAKTGLEHRGLGEEIFLSPLYDRIQKGRTPAEDLRDLVRKEGCENSGDFTAVVEACRYHKSAMKTAQTMAAPQAPAEQVTYAG